MKKSMLAMSVAAAIGGLGFAGSALAIQDNSTTSASATDLVVNAGGLGHKLLFPYFSAQGDNATLINVVNTDTVGKVVKFRFRGAGNSDDLLDFQVLMSPGDVWTAAVSQDPTTQKAKLTTSDSSCAIGLPTDGLFSALRTDPQKDVGETREGYLEVINMADIVTGSALYNTIKHASATKKPTCSLTVLDTALGTDIANEAAAAGRGITNPTTGLAGDWILLNQANTAAWSGSATALEARDAGGVPAAGRIVFWPQKFGTPTLTNGIESASADPLFQGGTAAIVKPQLYDFPDLSTPYLSNVSLAEVQADLTTSLLAVQAVANEYVTTDGIAAVTDWLFSQPTRRYHVAVDYKGLTGTAVPVFRPVNASAYYPSANITMLNRQACLNNTKAPGSTVVSFADPGAAVAFDVGGLFDREESTPGLADNPFVPSPNTPETTKTTYLCGEANVFSINAGGVTDASALSAAVARGDLTFTDATFTDGWASWGMGNTDVGIPVLGAAFVRASNGAVNYGFAFPHKTVAGVAP